MPRNSTRALQVALNKRLTARHRTPIAVDGVLGPETREAVRLVKYPLGFPKRLINGGLDHWSLHVITSPDVRPKSYLETAKKRQRAGNLRERALREARHCVGIMESGGNNRGAQVTALIRENGGTGPEPWCGDFQAHNYRVAGSKCIDRRSAAVALWPLIGGVKRTSSPEGGDLVRFTFDHIGMFVAFCDSRGHIVPRSQATHILTIEGNTGASGAVSDGNGNDGVYQKVRPIGVVRDYLRITR